MALRWECPTCHARYDDPLANGMRYFHACAPLAHWEKIALTDAELADLAGPLPDFPDDQARAQWLGLTTIERPGKRNEHIQPGWRPRTLANGNSDPDDPPAMIQGEPPRIDRGA